MIILFFFLLLPFNSYAGYFFRNIDKKSLIIKMIDQDDNTLVDGLILEPRCQLELDNSYIIDKKIKTCTMCIKGSDEQFFNQEITINLKKILVYSVIMNLQSAEFSKQIKEYTSHLENLKTKYFNTIRLRNAQLNNGYFIRNIDTNEIWLLLLNNINMHASFHLKPNEELFIPDFFYQHAKMDQLIFAIQSGVIIIESIKNKKPAIDSVRDQDEEHQSLSDQLRALVGGSDSEEDDKVKEEETRITFPHPFQLGTLTIDKPSWIIAHTVYNICHGVSPFKIEDYESKNAKDIEMIDAAKDMRAFFKMTFLNKPRNNVYYILSNHNSIPDQENEHASSSDLLPRLKKAVSDPDQSITK